MVIYGIIIVFFIFISFIKVTNFKETQQLGICFILLYLLATFRSVTVGSDTLNYYRLFEYVSGSNSFKGYTDRYEIGFLIFNKTVSFISKNFTVFLAIVNLFVYYAYYIFIKKYSKNYGLSILLFFTLGIWGKTINIIRFELAVAFFIYSYILWKKERKIYAIGLGIIAFFFQRISIVFFAMFFVPKRISKRFFSISLIISMVLFLGLETIIRFVVAKIPYYEHYFSDSKYIFGEIKLATVLQMILHLLIFVLSLRIYKRNMVVIEEDEKENIEFSLNMTFISALILLVSMRFNLIDRCEGIFEVFILLLLPNVCGYALRNKRVLIILICLVGISYFLIVNLFRPEWNKLIPYHTFLFDL